MTESLAQGYIHVWTLGETRGMEKHLKIFPFLKWLSYQSCHIQRAFCRASSSNNFHIYLIDALFYLKLWSSKSKGRKLYIVTKYWNQTITMYDTCNRKKKPKKKYSSNISLQSCIVFGIKVICLKLGAAVMILYNFCSLQWK